MRTPEDMAEALAMRITLAGTAAAATIIADGIREDRADAQLRIADLLAANTRYLEEARQARRERDALLRGFKGIAAAIAVAVKDDAP